jgi:acyl carrier protein
MSTLDRLAKVFQTVFDHDPGLFSGQTVPEDVAKWDSIGHMNLVGGLEAEFGLEFEIDEIMEMTSVARIVEILAARGVSD